MTDSSLLNLSYHSAGKFATEPTSGAINMRTGITQRGRDAFGTATRISASLFRRLSVFFESTPDQGPKAAKFAVLPPGHAGFPNRVKRSEGSDTTPTQNATCFAVCALVCDFSPKAECVPTFTRESEHGPFVREAEKHDERWSEIELLLIVRVH